jgi:hypothetical protein
MIECARCNTRFVPSPPATPVPQGPEAGPFDLPTSTVPAGEYDADAVLEQDDEPAWMNKLRHSTVGDHRQHSGLGMASFLIAVLVGGMDVVLGLITVLNVAGSGRHGRDIKESVVAGTISIACLNCLSVPVCLVGIGLAVMALVAHKNRNHLFTVIGLVVNSLVILGVLALSLYGSVN